MWVDDQTSGTYNEYRIGVTINKGKDLDHRKSDVVKAATWDFSDLLKTAVDNLEIYFNPTSEYSELYLRMRTTPEAVHPPMEVLDSKPLLWMGKMLRTNSCFVSSVSPAKALAQHPEKENVAWSPNSRSSAPKGRSTPPRQRSKFPPPPLAPQSPHSFGNIDTPARSDRSEQSLRPPIDSLPGVTRKGKDIIINPKKRTASPVKRMAAQRTEVKIVTNAEPKATHTHRNQLHVDSPRTQYYGHNSNRKQQVSQYNASDSRHAYSEPQDTDKYGVPISQLQ